MSIRLSFSPALCRATASTRSVFAATALVSLLVALASTQAAALTATFEDLGLDPSPPGEFLDPPTSGGSFVSGGVTLLNDGSFGGFSASTTSDTTTPGFTNQYSNITGEGAGGSSAVSYTHLTLPTKA